MRRDREEDSQSEVTLEMLYPHLTPEELAKVEETFERYIESTLRQYERICADPEAYARFRADLTDRKKYEIIDTSNH